ncbi:hypothetical protein BDL97_18G066600 [Sphagnum fallax]|nr:hypothetical protein BDL97_18G066600 [Sphagnum fallax]
MSAFKRLKLLSQPQQQQLLLFCNVGTLMRFPQTAIASADLSRTHTILAAASSRGFSSFLGRTNGGSPLQQIRSGACVLRKGFTGLLQGRRSGDVTQPPGVVVAGVVRWKYARGIATAALVRGEGVAKQAIGSFAAGTRVEGTKKSLSESIKHYARCYYELSKVRLSLLVVTTAGVGFVMGSGEVVDWVGLCWTTIGTMLAAASANAFNQIMEVTTDAQMKRTMRRPLPSGRMGMSHAVAFAVTMGVSGVTLLAWKANTITAELGAANVLLYTLVYTPLKQMHPINTWVGAVVGAIPPLMGWAAAAGQIDAGSWVLAAGLYFWQIPHFMSLAFLCRDDYAAGRYKMLSLSDATGHRTALTAFRNCIYLLPLGFLAHQMDITSGYFGVESLLLGACFGATAASFYFQPSSQTARKLFFASLLYLPVFMTAMICHRIPSPIQKNKELLEKSQQGLQVTQIGGESPLPIRDSIERKKPYYGGHMPVRPPIAFLSAAPFPFLPPPDDRTSLL